VNLALVAAALVGVQVGSTMVASDVIVSDVGTGFLAFLRYAIAVIVLLPFVRVKQLRAVAPRDLLPIAILGTAQFGALIALLNTALLYTDPARVTLVFSTLPLFTMIAESVIKRAWPDPIAAIAIALTLAGIVCMIGVDAFAGSVNARDGIGLGAVFLATLCGAVSAVFYRPYLDRYGALPISVLAMGASLIPLGLLALIEGTGVSPASWPVLAFWLIAFLGLASGIGYYLLLFALSRADPSSVTAFFALAPITAAVLSVWLLATPLAPGVYPAILLVSAGLFVLSRHRNATVPPRGHF